MKRDMDLVRQLLRVLEERPATSNVISVEVPGRNAKELFEHLQIMEQAGLVHGVSASMSSVCCMGLTWEGHEFLDAARSDTLWHRATELVLKQTGGLSIEVLKATLLQLALKSVGAG